MFYLVQDKVYLGYSPIILMKAKKNKVEIEGMRRANVCVYIWLYGRINGVN